MELRQTFPIGIGTYRIDISDPASLKGLQESYSLGQNYFDTSYLYEEGENLKFLKHLFATIPREKIFISTTLEKFIEKPEDVETQLDRDLTLLGLDYVDCLLAHEPAVSKIPLADTYSKISEMKNKGKTKSLGASNLSPNELKNIHASFPLSLFVGVYNLENKAYEDLGVLDFCREEGIEFFAYQPLRRNRTAKRNYPELTSLAKKYNKTQSQIILNWLVKRKNIHPLVQTTIIDHIKENIASLDFDLSLAEYEILDKFRSPDFDSIKIDWENNGEGIVIHQLPNQLP